VAPIPVIAPTIIRFSMHHNVPGGRQMTCVHDVSVDQFLGGRTAAVIAAVPLVVGAYQQRICGSQAPQVVFTGANFLDLDSLTGHGGFIAPIAGKPVTGTGSFTLLPPEVCYLLHKQCVHNRQERNGRTYMSGVPESAVDDGGVVVPATASAIAGNFNLWKDDMKTGTFFPPATVALRVVHVAGHTGTPVPGYPNGKPNSWSSSDVDSFQCDAKVATQRRRLRG
jgi:hypothetical protein